MRIVVLDGHTLNPGDNPWDPVARLGDFRVFDRTSREQIVERAGGAEILLTNKTPLTAQTLGVLPSLRFISVLATGYDVVDVTAARAREIPVSNVPEYGTDSVAQHTFALLLELTSRTAAQAAAVSDGEWIQSVDFSVWTNPPIELSGMTFGIVGFGRIGRRVADVARAFGMRVISASARPDDRPRLRALFAEADVVSLHCALGPDNFRFVDRDLLRRMKPAAFLLNTARGNLIDEAALREALDSGRIAGAGLDVVSREPIEPTNPLLGAPRLVLTPHVAWASLAARQRLMRTTARNVEAFIAGEPINRVA